jgi:hypothetical protein
LKAVDALLKGLVDYAGLFPPASESMRTALENYATYREGSDRAALGRFIVPVTRLAELEEQGHDLLSRGGGTEPWRLSVLVNGDVRAASDQMLRFNSRHLAGSRDGPALIDVVELKASDPSDVEQQNSRLPDSFCQYYEIPIQSDTAPFVEVIASVGARAKMRTGGVTPDAFPSARDIVAFMTTCHRKSVPFKATAGLHHPIRGSYRLTYEPASAKGVMFGFLNVFMAAALVYSGQGESAARDVLEETDPSAFAFSDNAITWRGIVVDVNRIAGFRSEFAISFGSCSFREPVDELAVLDHSLTTSQR